MTQICYKIPWSHSCHAAFTFLLPNSQSDYVAPTQLCNPIKHLPHPLIFARKRPARNQDFSNSLTVHSLLISDSCPATHNTTDRLLCSPNVQQSLDLPKSHFPSLYMTTKYQFCTFLIPDAYELGHGLANPGFGIQQGQEIFLSPQRPYQLLGPINPTLNGYQMLFKG